MNPRLAESIVPTTRRWHSRELGPISSDGWTLSRPPSDASLLFVSVLRVLGYLGTSFGLIYLQEKGAQGQDLRLAPKVRSLTK